ncbi:MAG: DsbA family oxidoreductase [Pseudomonadota bacterium]
MSGVGGGGPDITTDKPVLPVDVISDVMCPWCLIGKRRLETAAQLVADDITLEVHWRPFQLDATLPESGLDRKTYLENKFGGSERSREIYAHIKQTGTSEGIDFKFDKIAVSPNTLNAHRLIRFAGEENVETQNKVVEELFDSFFLNGVHIGDLEVLAQIGAKAGMAHDKLLTRLTSDEARQETSAEVARAHEIGVTGVPCFIFDRKIAVMGAQPADHLVQAMHEALHQRSPS